MVVSDDNKLTFVCIAKAAPAAKFTNNHLWGAHANYPYYGGF